MQITPYDFPLPTSHTPAIEVSDMITKNTTWALTLGLLGLSTTELCAQKMIWRSLPAKTRLTQSTGAVAAYDINRNIVLRFGGDSWTGLYEYDGKTWTHRSYTMQPELRTIAGGAYDASRGKFVIFGGSSKSRKLLKDTWEYDGKSWTPRIFLPKSPPATQGKMVYDSNRKLCVYMTFTNPMQTWEYNSKTWVQKKTKTTPTSINRFGVAYDSNRKVVVLYGGDVPGGTSSLTWEYDGLDWKKIAAKGSAGRRIWHDLVYDTNRKRIVLSGGQVYTGAYKPDYRTYEYDGKSWAPADVLTPFRLGKNGLPMCYNSKTKGVVATGHVYPYEYLPFPGTWTSFGKGCGSTAPVLAPNAGTYPKIGSHYPLSLTTLPKTTKGAILSLGTSRSTWLTLSLPLDLKIFKMPGCMLYQSMDFLWLMSPSGGTYKTTIPFPNTPALTGQKLYAQSLVVVPNVNPLWLQVSNGGEIWIGN